MNVSVLGYSGHNNRLVNFEENWIPYHEVEDAQLIHETTRGGCSDGETIDDFPEDVLQFSTPSKNTFSILFRKLFEFFGFKF